MLFGAQFINHVFYRGVSAILNLANFTLLISRVNDKNELAKIFFFLFIIGFLISSLRLFSHLASGLHDANSSSSKLRNTINGIYYTSIFACILLPLIGYVSFLHTNSYYIVFISAIILFSVMYDLDLLRAILGLSIITPLAFSAGSIVTFFGLLFSSDIDSIHACFLFLMQWIFIAIFNIKIFWRLRKYKNFFKVNNKSLKIISLIFISIYDGIVLNIPFFLVSDREASLDLSIVMRLFVASLFMLPLLTYWLNSGQLNKFSKKNKISLISTFASIMIASGFIIGLIYFCVFIWFGKVQVDIYIFIFFIILMISYTVYFTFIRFYGSLLPDNNRIIYTSILLTLFIVFFVYFMDFLMLNSYALIGLQSFTLILSGIVFRILFFKNKKSSI